MYRLMADLQKWFQLEARSGTLAPMVSKTEALGIRSPRTGQTPLPPPDRKSENKLLNLTWCQNINETARSSFVVGVEQRLLKKGNVCLYVWVFYIGRNPNCWTNRDEIQQGCGPWGWEGSWFFGYLVGLDTLYPDPQGGPKEGQVGFRSLSRGFGQKFYQTKVAGHPQLSGVGLNLEGPGPGVLLEPPCLAFKGS